LGPAKNPVSGKTPKTPPKNTPKIPKFGIFAASFAKKHPFLAFFAHFFKTPKNSVKHEKHHFLP